jgi:hypothetical protein
MDLVERYIEAIKFWLPKHLKEDIAAELKEDIRSQIEEAERAKGRPLNEDEVAALLKARGTPLAVASRYLPQHTLIGPELYPLYFFVLKIVAAVCFLLPLAAWIGTLFIDPTIFPPNAIASPVNSLLVAFAITTIVFAVIERNGVNPAKSDKWNPKTLRPVIDRGRIKRSVSVGDIIGSLIVVGFFAAGYLSETTYHLINGDVTLCPEWVPYWQFVVLLVIAEAALAAVNLFKPYWSGWRVLLRMALDLAKTAAFGWLLQSHLLRDIAAPGFPPEAAAKIVAISDTAARFAVPLTAILAAAVVVTALWRVFRLLRQPAARSSR